MYFAPELTSNYEMSDYIFLQDPCTKYTGPDRKSKTHSLTYSGCISIPDQIIISWTMKPVLDTFHSLCLYWDGTVHNSTCVHDLISAYLA